jgi:hypothetical protein
MAESRRNEPDVTLLGAGLWRKGDRIESEGQAEALNWLIDYFQSAEDHIAGLCKELDSRAPGWENEMPWYARAKKPDPQLEYDQRMAGVPDE